MTGDQWPQGFPVLAFGTWDAPMTDGATWIDVVPIDVVCMHCRQQFVEGDNGAILPTGFATHRECSLRSVMGGIGHVVDHATYCRGEHGPDAGLTYRQSAWLLWRHVVERIPVTASELDVLRKIEHGT